MSACVLIEVRKSAGQRTIASPPRLTSKVHVASGGVAMASPPRPRINTRPTEVVRDGRSFPTGEPSSPLAGFRQRIVSMDRKLHQRCLIVADHLRR